jgi:hypothetical protein
MKSKILRKKEALFDKERLSNLPKFEGEKIEQKKVRIDWSHFRLPGFKRAKDGIGYVPCKECAKKKLQGECFHW